MTGQLQTILGAGGIIGKSLAGSLRAYTNRIRLVSRQPQPVNESDETLAADLTIPEETFKAVEGSEVVYLTVGLRYHLPTWERDWPLVIQNVAEACVRYQARLVFFDNVYAYGRVQSWMTEKTPMNPNSEKGKIRASLVDTLVDMAEAGKLQMLVARSADYYGPDARKSLLYLLVLRNLAKGKNPQWLVNDEVKHSFTYTADAAKATALLGNTRTAYDQIWHLPTDKNVMNGREIITLLSEIYDREPDYLVLKKWMTMMSGMFNSVLGEFNEMLYQFEYDYLFDSSKFLKHFDFGTTPYKQGLLATARALQMPPVP
jgi:nucleoside-diphosphate-sugar epimerase